MPENARQHMPTGADRVAAAGIAGSNSSPRPAISRPWSRNSWPRRSLVRIRLMTRLRPVRRSLPVRNLITLLGGIIAVVLSLSIPVGYGIIGYFKEGHALTYMAELSSVRAAQYIYAPDAPWRYDTDQLAAISEIRTATAAPIVQRILDKQGAEMMHKGDPLPWPTFARRAPIFAAGAMVGSVEVSASLRPLLAEVASVALGSLALAIAAYFAFARLPLGVLDRTLDELKTANDKFNAQLARQNKLLKDREEELEAQNTRFDAAISNMSQGMCLFNAEQRVLFANRRFAELYHLDPEQVKPGTTLRQILEARLASGAYGNTDCAKFVADGIASFCQEVSQILPLADGRFISVLRRPMPNGGVLSTHEDVTERETLAARLAAQNELLRQHEEELQAQNERFDAALKNMSHGLCMFDAEQRVVMSNMRYAEIYGLTPEQIKPGTTLRQIVQYRIAKGLYAGANPEEYIKERLASFDEASVAVHRLSDGRAISITRQPMRGGGWVTTHSPSARN